MPTGDDSDGASSQAANSEQAVLALRRASDALQQFLIAQARTSDLGLLEFLVLCRATENHGVGAGEVGRALGLGTSTMTGLADRLERSGLIRRAPHPGDRRLVLLQATAKGRRLTDRLLGPMLTALTELLDEQLGFSERALIARFLNDAASLISAHAAVLEPQRGSFRARNPARKEPNR